MYRQDKTIVWSKFIYDISFSVKSNDRTIRWQRGTLGKNLDFYRLVL